jgi:nucleoside-diphosphate-sugar epimerase
VLFIFKDETFPRSVYYYRSVPAFFTKQSFSVMKKEKILVIGAHGQIGTELTTALKIKYGADHVIATDISIPAHFAEEQDTCLYLDVLNRDALDAIVIKHKITQIYLLAAMLSANGEQQPMKAWELNMQSLINVLECAREHSVVKVFWPSSVAVFGPHTPKTNCPQHTVLQPTTMYGVSKAAGEDWCNYYYKKYEVDVRSIRFPGLIGYSCPPGGGTTDYAVDIFHQAIHKGRYTCFLEPDTCLPMLYMPDAISAILALMEAPKNQLTVRTSYNISSMSFTPAELAAEINKILPAFKIDYAPDYRQQIADSWPQHIDATFADKDWNWQPKYDLQAMTEDMIQELMYSEKPIMV